MEKKKGLIRRQCVEREGKKEWFEKQWAIRY
jgi:hypothetical protein